MNFLKPSRAVALLFLLFYHFSLLAQEAKYPFVIPIGESVYTQIQGTTDLVEPYSKTFIQKHGNAVIKVIETGDYVIQQDVASGELDTLFFEIRTLTINGRDTLVEAERFEHKKKVLTSFRTQLHKLGDRLYLKPKTDSETNVHPSAANTFVNLKEVSLYFKLEPSESFRFYRQGTALGLMTLPVRIRTSILNDELWTTAESGLNNLAFFGGFRSSWYRYEAGDFKQFNLLVGPYAGLTVSKISPASTDFTIEEEIRKPGVTAGLSFLVGFERLHFGLAVGIESVFGGETLNWAHQNKAYYGFSIAYTGPFESF